jgi:hypothetical protein
VRVLICATAAAVLMSGAVASTASSQGKGKKHAKHATVTDDAVRGSGVPKHVTLDDDSVRGSGAPVALVFGNGDVKILRTHYAPRYRNLPPGLQKKLARGGHLPPGWQKKLEPFPVFIEERLPPLPVGYRRGVFDGHAIIYNSRANVLVDVAVMF